MEVYIFAFFATISGLMLGSFYNACIDRYIAESDTTAPSGAHCSDYGKPLLPKEMVPIVSYLILKGRCSSCKAAIPLRYPVVETVSVLSAMLLALRFGGSPEWFIYLIVTGVFIVASGIDAEIMILPDVIILPGFLFSAFAAIVLLKHPPLEVLGSAAAGAGIFWLLRFIYGVLRGQDGLGLGDVKLMLMIGALCGPTLLPFAVFLGCLCALLTALTSRA